jgi:hypothetical protein
MIATMNAKKNPTAPEANLMQDRPSQRMLKTWAKRITRGRATTIPVFIGGQWSLQIPRGHKRLLQLGVNDKK